MSEFFNFALQFADNHCFLAFYILLIVMNLTTWPFRLVNRYIRHKNIKAAGWPPKNLDADGDPRTFSSSESKTP